MKKLLIIFVFCFSINSVFADSPLTSTDFYRAYMDIPLISKTSQSDGVLTDEVFEYLNSENSIDKKIALINSLKWNIKGKNNAKLYFKKLALIHPDYTNKNFFKKGTAEELICYAYLKAMDNYFDVTDAFEIAGEAVRKYPDSFAVNMIYNLIKSQGLTAFGEYCYASKLFLSLKDNPKFKMDMRKESTTYIFEYMEEIGKNCKKE